MKLGSHLSPLIQVLIKILRQKPFLEQNYQYRHLDLRKEDEIEFRRVLKNDSEE